MGIIFSPKIARLWNEWELRALILTSLVIQILLIGTASIRKHRASRKIIFLIWSCYLLADWVATFALGVIAKKLVIKNSDGGGGGGGDELIVLWVPFLLLHLGGPDSITAFALQDNELWLRHLLGLLFQVGTAFYIFFSSLPDQANNRLLLVIMTVLMFMAGIIKYVERTLALMNASRDHFRKSMVNANDYHFRKSVVTRNDYEVSDFLDVYFGEGNEDSQKLLREIQLISKAHEAFQKLKRLVVDLVLNVDDLEYCSTIMRRISWEEAYKVIEIELGFLYEVLYTKAVVVRSLKGWILRFTSVSSIIAASIIFFAFIDHDHDDQNQDRRIDVTITYVLLSGAIALEFWSLTRLIFTDWTVAWMGKKKINPRLARFVFEGAAYIRRISPKRSRWSNSMAQYNLIECCLKDMQQPRSLLFRWGNKVMKPINVKDLFDHYGHRTCKNISEELKKFILEDLKLRVQFLEDTDFRSYQRFRTCRGELALKAMIDTDEVLDNSISAEFDESILLWHIATDICYYLDGEKQNLDKLSDQRISRDISNYMLYLLVSRPFMLPAGIGQVRFGDTCAEAKECCRMMETINGIEACKRLQAYEQNEKPIESNRSRSVLLKAVKVAKSLSKQEPVEKRWQVISLVWSEMLCYAATHCRGYYHAQRLATGGELLTLVYFLLAHLGIGEQFRPVREISLRVE